MVFKSCVETTTGRFNAMQPTWNRSATPSSGNAAFDERQDNHGQVAFHRKNVRQLIDLHGMNDPEKLQSLFNVCRRSIVIGFEVRFGYTRPHMHRRWITRILERVEVEELGHTN